MEDEKRTTGFDRSDRDLLVRLDTRFTDLNDAIKKMDHTYSQEIGALRASKLEKTEFTTYVANNSDEHNRFSHEREKLFLRSDAQNRMLWIGVGVIVTLQFVIPLGAKILWP